MADLDPKAFAECGDNELDERDGVQEVDEDMILAYVLAQNELPEESARPFAEWLHEAWTSFNEAGEWTNGDVIASALNHWRGGK